MQINPTNLAFSARRSYVQKSEGKLKGDVLATNGTLADEGVLTGGIIATTLVGGKYGTTVIARAKKFVAQNILKRKPQIKGLLSEPQSNYTFLAHKLKDLKATKAPKKSIARMQRLLAEATPKTALSKAGMAIAGALSVAAGFVINNLVDKKAA